VARVSDSFRREKSRELEMVARLWDSKVAPEYVRPIVLGFGMRHAYRVLSFDEIAQEIPNVGRNELKETLEQLATEGLVTRFSRRFCFNKAIPPNLTRHVESAITPSENIRVFERGTR
jgi:hypothetical protein